MRVVHLIWIKSDVDPIVCITSAPLSGSPTTIQQRPISLSAYTVDLVPASSAMAVNNKSAAKQTSSARPSIPPPAPVSTDSTTNGKRKKKKKGKGRADTYDEDDDDDTHRTDPTPHPTTGLTPAELESAHLSANAAVDKAMIYPSRELQETARELYSHFMDPPAGHRDGEEYWSSLPSQTREFVRNVHSQAALATGPGDMSKAQTMFAIAQQMIQSGKGANKGLPGSYPPSVPLDPAVFSDPAIKLSLEAAFNNVAANGGFPPLDLGWYRMFTLIYKRATTNGV